MNNPCANKATCLPCGDAPLANLSSEAPDLQVFRATAWVKLTPPLGTGYNALSCQVTAESSQSAEIAALEAEAQAILCATSSWFYPVAFPPPVPLPPAPPPVAPQGGQHRPFASNTAQQGEAACADGQPYFFDVPPGLFVGPTLAAANAAAISYGNRQAALHLLCLGDIPLLTCVGAAYSASITATSAFLAVAPQTNLWQIFSGTLPPGLVFHGGALTGNPAITGTPGTPGDYDFVVGVTLPNGDTTSKEYFLTVAGITNATNLPTATTGTAYAATLTAVGFNDPVYSVSDIPLPDGLALSSNGTISGTPANDAVTGTFTVFVRDGVTGFECSQSVTVNVVQGFSFDAMMWTNIWGGHYFNPDPPAGNVFHGFILNDASEDIVLGKIATKPGTACNLKVVVSNLVDPASGWGQAGGQCQITISSGDSTGPINQILSVTSENGDGLLLPGNGTYNAPFTLPHDGLPFIYVQVYLNSFSPLTVNVDGTLTPG